MPAPLDPMERIRGTIPRRLAFLGLLDRALTHRGGRNRPLLVGPSAVEWFTDGHCPASRLHLFSPEGPLLLETLGDLGFRRIGNREVLANEELQLLLDLETPSPPALEGIPSVWELEIHLTDPGAPPLRLRGAVASPEGLILHLLRDARAGFSETPRDMPLSRQITSAMMLLGSLRGDLNREALGDAASREGLTSLWDTVLSATASCLPPPGEEPPGPPTDSPQERDVAKPRLHLPRPPRNLRALASVAAGFAEADLRDSRPRTPEDQRTLVRFALCGLLHRPPFCRTPEGSVRVSLPLAPRGNPPGTEA